MKSKNAFHVTRDNLCKFSYDFSNRRAGGPKGRSPPSPITLLYFYKTNI